MSGRRAPEITDTIVGAARTQIAEEGLRGLTIRKVAARAGRSRGGVAPQGGLKADLVATLVSDSLAFQRRRHVRWQELTAKLDLSDVSVLASVIGAYLDEAACQDRFQSMVLCELVAESARKKERHPAFAQLVADEEKFWQQIQRGSEHAKMLGWAIAHYCRDELPFALALTGEPAYRLLRSGTISRLTRRFEPDEGRGFGTGLDSFVSASSSQSGPLVLLPSGKQRPSQIGIAVAALIQREGVANVSHRNVAANAGIAKSTIAHHFRTREHLLKAGFEEIYRQLAAADHPLHHGDQALPDMTLSTASHAMAIEAARDPKLVPAAFNLRTLRGEFIVGDLEALLGAGRTDFGALQAAGMVIVGCGLALHLTGGNTRLTNARLEFLLSGQTEKWPSEDDARHDG